jgi:hypothetical protein
MATHNNSGRVRKSVYIWVEQVWPIGPWELPRSSCSTSSSCAKKQENSKCACYIAPLFILLCIFLLLFDLVIIRHQSHEEGTKKRYLSCITQRVMGLKSLHRLLEAGATRLLWMKMAKCMDGAGTRSYQINHMLKCIISPLRTVCELWASIVSVTRLTDGSVTLLQFGQVGVNNTEDQNYPQIVKGLADQVTFKTILSGYHLVLR